MIIASAAGGGDLSSHVLKANELNVDLMICSPKQIEDTGGSALSIDNCCLSLLLGTRSKTPVTDTGGFKHHNSSTASTDFVNTLGTVIFGFLLTLAICIGKKYIERRNFLRTPKVLAICVLLFVCF